MTDFNKLLYLPLDLPNPPGNPALWDTFTDDMFYVDNYRSCRHIGILLNGEFTKESTYTPELVEWIKEYILPIADIVPRIMIITTEANDFNAPHIDCSVKKFVTNQHKLRYVFQGTVDSLYFIHKDGTEHPKQIDAPFAMSGKWPHAMLNNQPQRKYTLAIGAPWEPELNNPAYRNLLERSYKKYHDYYMGFDKYALASGWQDLFEDKYKIDLSMLDNYNINS